MLVAATVRRGLRGEAAVKSARAVGLIAVCLAAVLLGLGLGWTSSHPTLPAARLALVGLALGGLVWPVLVLLLVHHAGKQRAAQRLRP
jgi:hypothetical protein